MAKVAVDEGLVRREGPGLVVDVEVEELGKQKGTEAALDDLQGLDLVNFAAILLTLSRFMRRR